MWRRRRMNPVPETVRNRVSQRHLVRCEICGIGNWIPHYLLIRNDDGCAWSHLVGELLCKLSENSNFRRLQYGRRIKGEICCARRSPRRDRYPDYAEGKTRQFKPGSFARAGALPIAVPVTAGNPRPVPIIMVVVVIPIIMAVVAVPVVTTTVIISRGRSRCETRSPK